MWLKYYDSTGNELGRVSSRQIASLTSHTIQGTGVFSIQATTASGALFEVSPRIYTTAADAVAAIDPLLASEIEN